MEFFTLPQIIGYIAYAFSFYACLQKDDNKMFRFFAYAWALFCVHHYMMGNYTASTSGAVISARMYLSQYYKGSLMAFSFAFLAVILAAYTYQSPYSLLPLAAVLSATFGSAYFSGIGVRISFILGCLFWFIHNFATHSIGGMALDITALTMHTITCMRLYADKKKTMIQRTETVSSLP